MEMESLFSSVLFDSHVQMSGVSTWPASSAAALQTSTVTNTNNESVPSVSTSDGTNESETGLDEDGNDAEGVWSPDIEQSFLVSMVIWYLNPRELFS